MVRVRGTRTEIHQWHFCSASSGTSKVNTKSPPTPGLLLSFSAATVKQKIQSPTDLEKCPQKIFYPICYKHSEPPEINMPPAPSHKLLFLVGPLHESVMCLSVSVSERELHHCGCGPCQKNNSCQLLGQTIKKHILCGSQGRLIHPSSEGHHRVSKPT